MEEKQNLEGLVLAIIGVGGTSSIGSVFCNHLVSNSYYVDAGVIGGTGINKILLNDIDKAKVAAQIEDHMKPFIEGNEKLQKQLYNTFAVEDKEIHEIAEQADIVIFTYENVFGAMQKKIHGKTDIRPYLFNSNIEIFESQMKDHFTGYKGMMVFCTNPCDYMAYFASQMLPGLDKSQIVGFNHVDTRRFREELKKQLKKNLSKMELDALKNLDVSNAFMIGDHGKNSFGKFSGIVYGSGTQWNDNKKLDKKELKELIVKAVHSKAAWLRKVMTAPNTNCVPPLLEVVAGMVTGTGVFGMSHYLEMVPEELKKEIKDKYGIDINGLYTGVPVQFLRSNRIIRARIADGCRSADSEYVIDTSDWAIDDDKLAEDRYVEESLFDKAITSNVIKLAEAFKVREIDTKYARKIAKSLKQEDIDQKSTIDLAKKYNASESDIKNALKIINAKQKNKSKDEKAYFRWLTESTMPILSSLISSELGMVGDEDDTLECRNPAKQSTKVIAIAADENRIIAAAKEYEQYLHYFEMPYNNLEDLASREIDHKIKDDMHVRIGEYKADPILHLGLFEEQAYSVRIFDESSEKNKKEKSLIEIRDVKNLRKDPSNSKEHDFGISAFILDKENKHSEETGEEIRQLNAIYCGTADGEIKKINPETLEVQDTYACKEAESFDQIRAVEYKKKKYILGASDSGRIYMLDTVSGQLTDLKITAQSACFDVQSEKFPKYSSENPVDALCVYCLDKSHNISITPVMTDNDLLDPAGRQILIKENKKDFTPSLANRLQDKDKTRDLRVQGEEVILMSETGIVSYTDKNQDPKIVPFKNIGDLWQIEFAKRKD